MRSREVKASEKRENPIPPVNRRSFNYLMNCLGSALILVLLAGCAPMKPPTSSEIEQSRKALVLIRIVTTDQLGKKGGPWNLNFGLGSAETGGVPEGCEFVGPTCPKSLSDESWAEGWVYYLLSPGTYSLAGRPHRRGNLFTYLASFRSAPRWVFEVPPKTPVVYAGTLNLHVSVENGVTSHLYAKRTSITDDEALALRVASKHYPNLKPVRTILMEPHVP